MDKPNPTDIITMLRERGSKTRAAGHDAIPEETGSRLTLDELRARFEAAPTVGQSLEEQLIDLDEENRRLRSQINWQEDLIDTLGVAGALSRLALSELLKPGEGIVLDAREILEGAQPMEGEHGPVQWIYFFNRADGGGIDLCDTFEDPTVPHGTRLSACGKPGMLRRG